MEAASLWFSNIQQALASNDWDTLKSLSHTAYTTWDQIPLDYRCYTFLDQPGVGTLMGALWTALEHNQPTVTELTTLLWKYIREWNARLAQLSAVQVPTLPDTLPSTPSESNYSEFVDPGEETELGALNDDGSGAMNIEAANLPSRRLNVRALKYKKSDVASVPCHLCAEAGKVCYNVAKSKVSVCWECKVTNKKCSNAKGRKHFQVDEDSVQVILETLSKMQSEQRRRDLIRDQRDAFVLSKLQEGARGRELMYGALQRVEAWITSLPLQQPCAGEEVEGYQE